MEMKRKSSMNKKNSNSHLRRQIEDLRTDFPRVLPLTTSKEIHRERELGRSSLKEDEIRVLIFQF